MRKKKRCPTCGGIGEVMLEDHSKRPITYKRAECQTCNGTGWYRKSLSERKAKP